jgi:hypothetical protein
LPAKTRHYFDCDTSLASKDFGRLAALTMCMSIDSWLAESIVCAKKRAGRIQVRKDQYYREVNHRGLVV